MNSGCFCDTQLSGIMDSLHKREAKNIVEPNEGERTLLCSNKGGIRSPSLDLQELQNATQDRFIQILAGILFRAFKWEYDHGKHSTKESSDLLSGINEGTGRRRQ